MKKIKKYSKAKLDAYEQSIEDSLTEEIMNEPLDPDRALELRTMAGNTLRELKSARANIRINEQDMQGLRRLADQAGMPYQTLLTHVLHLYVTNQLVSVQEVKKMADAGIFDRRKVAV